MSIKHQNDLKCFKWTGLKLDIVQPKENLKNIPLECGQVRSVSITSCFAVIRIWRWIKDAPRLVSSFSPAAQHEPTAPNISSDRFALAPPTFCGWLRGTSDRCIISVKWAWLIYCFNEIAKINNCINLCMLVVYEVSLQFMALICIC